MDSLYDGSLLIIELCKPLEIILTKHSIGRFLQFTHLFGYISLVTLAFIYPQTRLLVLTIMSIVLLLFILYRRCILTKAEIYYLEKFETTPGLFLDAFGLRPSNRKTDEILQKSLSILLLSIPIIFILIVKSKHIVSYE
jgi:hypothetical protein